MTNIPCFDGFGKAKDAAIKAKELGHPALGLTNHGNITGLIKHFNACKEQEVVPILGCEFYFQPKIDKEKPKYHLCLYAKNMEGWKNLNRLITVSNSDENFYYKGTVSFKELAKYNEGIVCSSACINGYISQLAVKGKEPRLDKALNKFKQIYGDDFYMEIMPFEVDDNGEDVQISTNTYLLNKCKEHNVLPIVTTDCHFIGKDDFPTYLKMHEIKNSKYGIHYVDRYMHTQGEILAKLHKHHEKSIKLIAKGMDQFYESFATTLEWFCFDNIQMPKYKTDDEEVYTDMVTMVKSKLKSEGKTSKEYRDRLAYEADIIKYHGFQNYFMIVQEYVNWAKDNGIPVGPGRGSAGNSLINYGLGITDLDPVYFGNNFDRFLRKDKKKFPDIDVDFCTKNRDKVINHIVNTYEGQAAQTLTYGTYNILNLTNDLVKVCGMEAKDEIAEFKKFLGEYCSDSEHTIDDKIYTDKRYKSYNRDYDDIVVHFIKMYGKVRFFGTHASSVILSEEPIASQAGLMRVSGSLRTSFDLSDIEFLKLVKLDILGLSTVTKVAELRKKTKTKFSYDILEDPDMLKRFNDDGLANVFQFESQSSCDIARRITVTSFEDIVVATCLNRPGPLSMGLDKKYAEAKQHPDESVPWYKYTKNTYGVLIYQEQGMDICRNIGQFDPENTDKLVKADILHIPQEQQDIWREEFYKGAKEYGLTKAQTEEVFGSLLLYSFNRGHGVAYAMLSAELMYYKVKYPLLFWYYTLKHENNEEKLRNQKSNAVKDGAILLLPHINGSANFSMRTIDGDKCIQEGLSSIKNVGEKAALIIEEERKRNGPYASEEDFLDRISNIGSRAITKRTIEALKEGGAMEFNNKVYYNRVAKYNSSLYIR